MNATVEMASPAAEHLTEPSFKSARSSKPPQNILVRGVNWLGDAVMTTPALSRLRERFPEARIALLTHEKLKELWEGDPRVNTVIGFAPGESPWSIARRLRPEHFKTALILPNSPRSALEMWLAGIPRRVGFERAWRNWLLTDRVPLRSQAVQVRKRSVQEIKRLIQSGAGTVESVPASIESHQIYDYLTLTAALGATLAPLQPRLHVREEEVRAVAERLWIIQRGGIATIGWLECGC